RVEQAAQTSEIGAFPGRKTISSPFRPGCLIATWWRGMTLCSFRFPTATRRSAWNAGGKTVMSASRLLSAKPRIAVNVSGSGEAVIFLHGVGTTRTSWDAQLAHFKATHLAVAWDARGYGDSDDYESDLNFAADFSDDLARVLDELDIQT